MFVDHLNYDVLSAKERIYVQQAQSKLTISQGFASVDIYYSKANRGWILYMFKNVQKFGTFSSTVL